MNHRINAWKEGALVYGPWLLVGLTCACPAWPKPVFAAGILFLAAGLFALFFFRDPPRTIAAAPNEIMAPADGTVVAIEELEQSPYYDGPCRRVSIFLSIFNVHVNRTPFAGRVLAVEHRPGQFRNAMNAETSDCNEATTVRLETKYGPVTVRQIAGLIARRIVCRLAPGESVQKGEKFGMIRFGSRTELYLPIGAEVSVSVRDKVRAGTTVVGRFAIPATTEERPKRKRASRTRRRQQK